jgi:hypothetical protein
LDLSAIPFYAKVVDDAAAVVVKDEPRNGAAFAASISKYHTF